MELATRKTLHTYPQSSESMHLLKVPLAYWSIPMTKFVKGSFVYEIDAAEISHYQMLAYN